MITQAQDEQIYNALLVGMDLESALVFAGVSSQDIAGLKETPADGDDPYEVYRDRYRRLTGQFEFSLLSDLQKVIRKQVAQGRESAITWSLEHMVPRFSAKPQPMAPSININVPDFDPSTVQINK